MSIRKPPTSLSVSNKLLLEMQDEVRVFFGWDVVEDLNSAKQLLSRVENSYVEKWERQNRLSAVSRLYRRLVIRHPTNRRNRGCSRAGGGVGSTRRTSNFRVC